MVMPRLAFYFAMLASALISAPSMSTDKPAPITRHPIEQGDYDEPDHPIPSIHVVDVWAAKKAGGADLSIIVASPLRNDRHSRERLHAKIEGYLSFLRSEAFEREAGTAAPGSTSIIVHIHPGSDPKVLEFIRSYRSQVELGGATLELRTLKLEE